MSEGLFLPRNLYKGAQTAGRAGRAGVGAVQKFAEQHNLGDIPGSPGWRTTDLLSLLIPQSASDVLLTAIPAGWAKRAATVPISKLSRFAKREGIEAGDLTEALGKTLGDRLKPAGASGKLYEDVASGERFIEDDLKRLFGEDVLQRADVLPYTPKPKDVPGRAPDYQMEWSRETPEQFVTPEDRTHTERLERMYNTPAPLIRRGFRTGTTQQLEARLAQLDELSDEAMEIVAELENRRGPRGTTPATVDEILSEQVQEEIFTPPRRR